MLYMGENALLGAKVQSYLSKVKGKTGTGVSAAIIKEGKLIVACTAGILGQDSSEADINDLYNVGSVSKIYCTLAIMKLVELYNINIDEKVITYVPKFKMKDERYKDITIRMLLNHSSGMPGGDYHNAMCTCWMGEHIKEANYKYYANAKLKAAPGLFSTYCNDGFDLAATLIEEVSNEKYITFLKKHITDKVGAISTGIGEVALERGRMQCEIGKKTEFVSAMGAGAIRTTLTDCAKVGYLFINPKGIITQDAIDEMCKPQGKTFLTYDSTAYNYGLGWDNIEFTSPKVELGKHVLHKDGGTVQFNSELMVCPELKVSAAISATNDCEMHLLNVLYEMIAIIMEGEGCDIRKSDILDLKFGDFEGKPVPKDWIENHSGVYYSANEIIKFVVEDEKLNIMQYNDNKEWEADDWFGELKWNGNTFVSQKVKLLFERHEEKEYMILERPSGRCYPYAQKHLSAYDIHTRWKKRLGKKYISCNLSSVDTDISSGRAAAIWKVIEEELLIIKLVNGSILPLKTVSEYETDMILNVPDSSTDIYAPFIVVKDGIEYLHISSEDYMDTDAIPFIQSGRVFSDLKEKNVLFKTIAGQRLLFEKPLGVEVIMFNEELEVTYMSHYGKDMPQLEDGYIAFVNDREMDFYITITEVK